MKYQLLVCLILISLLFVACNSAIKDNETQVKEEPGTAIVEESTSAPAQRTAEPRPAAPLAEADLIGFWVGPFRKKDDDDAYLYVDDGFVWNRNNKINISIDQITDSLVFGHSVVAGNDRPFQGTMTKHVSSANQAISYTFEVREPGDHTYDGVFKFMISGDQMTGNWSAFNDIEIKERVYTLEKREFAYNPDIMLEKAKAYVDWNNEKTSRFAMEEGELGEWMRSEFESATDLIYEVNASNTLLSQEEVENMKRGDLTIIRNAIYARHGYSFKNRPLRVFFDAQSWYVPVYANIQKEFTDIEKANIKLLLKYEQNAVTYYDYFGRG